MSAPDSRPVGDTPPAVELCNLTPNQGAQGVFNAPVTFDQRSIHAPALTATIEITNYGASTITPPVRAPTAQEKSNRARMLARVRDSWVGGVLESSLQGAALLALELEQRPEAVIQPWERLVQQPGQTSRAVAPGTPIR